MSEGGTFRVSATVRLAFDVEAGHSDQALADGCDVIMGAIKHLETAPGILILGSPQGAVVERIEEADY